MTEREKSMSGGWEWLIGRKLSLGVVVDVFEATATVRHGDDDSRVLICELLHEDYKAQDRYVARMCEALNSGDGTYRP